MKNRNYVAKNLHKACRASIIPHKASEKKQAIELQEMIETASMELFDALADERSNCLNCIGCKNIKTGEELWHN